MKHTPVLHASRLGFGCASLGSRVDRRDGLRALARAYELGINWFDLAPSYGDGMAEEIFSEFVRGRRAEIHICTKVGLAPPTIGPLMRALRPAARAVVRAAPSLRAVAGRGRAGAVRKPLDAATIVKSLDDSLRRLGVDHVDVLALHEPTSEDLYSPGVVEASQKLLRSGKVGRIGVAGDAEIAAGALAAGDLFEHLQMADGPGETGLANLRRAFPARLDELSLVTHSVFTRPRVLDLLAVRGRERKAAESILDAHGYGDMPFDLAIRAASLDLALLSNDNGIVVVSMLGAGRAEFNIERIGAFGTRDPARLFRTLDEAVRRRFVAS